MDAIPLSVLYYVLYLPFSRRDCPLLFPLSNALVFSVAHVYRSHIAAFPSRVSAAIM
jgi:hypothetical protein